MELQTSAAFANIHVQRPPENIQQALDDVRSRKEQLRRELGDYRRQVQQTMLEIEQNRKWKKGV